MILAPDDPRHGTVTGYNNHRCRCDGCREAWRVYHLAYLYRTGRQRPMAEFLASRMLSHGTISGYKRGCRCDLCQPVGAATRKMYRDRVKARAAS